MTTMQVRTHSLPCNGIRYEKLIHPRLGLDFVLRYTYYQAMLAGDKFPPIAVSLIGGKYLLVDGVHRWEATKMVLKAMEKPQSTPIEVEMITCKNLDEAFIEAITRNMTHGQPLCTLEKIDAYTRLSKSMPLEKIAALLHWEPSYLRIQIKKRIDPETGRAKTHTLVGVKSINIPTRQEQKIYTGSTQLHLIQQVIMLLKQGVLDVHNKEVMKALKELKDWLNRMGLD